MSGAMQSSVGNPQVYEDNSQKESKNAEVDNRDRFEEGKPNSHLANDSKDERSIANRLAREEQRDEDDGESKETKLGKIDATLPAKSHGNKPSRGAEIDQEIREEEEEILKKKGAWGPKQ